MVKEEAKLIDSVSSEAQRAGRITERQKSLLLKVFGRRFQNAWKAVEDVAVKRYVFKPSGRVVWIVVGKERDYQVLPDVNYCSCDDFYFRVLSGDTSLCYHVIAQKLAEALNRYEPITDSDEIYESLMKEWRFIKG